MLAMAGEKSLLGEESREDGLEDSEWGDMGLARGEAPWWSEDRWGTRGYATSERLAWQRRQTDLRGSSATAWSLRPT